MIEWLVNVNIIGHYLIATKFFYKVFQPDIEIGEGNRCIDKRSKEM